jgi:hypothetical protein
MYPALIFLHGTHLSAADVSIGRSEKVDINENAGVDNRRIPCPSEGGIRTEQAVVVAPRQTGMGLSAPTMPHIEHAIIFGIPRCHRNCIRSGGIR